MTAVRRLVLAFLLLKLGILLTNLVRFPVLGVVGTGTADGDRAGARRTDGCRC